MWISPWEKSKLAHKYEFVFGEIRACTMWIFFRINSELAHKYKFLPRRNAYMHVFMQTCGFLPGRNPNQHTTVNFSPREIHIRVHIYIYHLDASPPYRQPLAEKSAVYSTPCRLILGPPAESGSSNDLPRADNFTLQMTCPAQNSKTEMSPRRWLGKGSDGRRRFVLSQFRQKS